MKISPIFLASRLSFLVISLLPLLVSAQTITGYESDGGIWFEKYDSATVPVPETHGLHTGDLIFVRDTAGMGAAVMESTGNFSHVAIVVCPRYWEQTMVYEAVPGKGVTRTELSAWLEDQGANTAMLGSPAQNRLVSRRLATEFDTTQLLLRLNYALGAPYDPYFAANNGLYYCSELVESCFVRPNGRRIFETKPMNFRAADGSMPKFWVEWFSKLGCPIPEGQPGTNPTDLYYSPLLASPKF